LEADRGDAEVAVAELALDHHQRHAIARHLDGVRVAELVGREPARTPAAAPVRRSPARTAVLDHSRPLVSRSMTQNSGPTGTRAGGPAMAAAAPTPTRQANLAAPAALAVANE
jgi:hypothetical protein